MSNTASLERKREEDEYENAVLYSRRSYCCCCRNDTNCQHLFKVIPFNCIAHPFCPSFFAWLVRARSELDRFPMEAERFREINGRFLPNELGDPTFLFHLFKENTTLHDIFKFEEFFIIQFWNISVDSLLQSDFRRFTASVQTHDLPIILK